MALDFNDVGDLVLITASSSINSLLRYTRLFWVWFDSFAPSGFAALCGKSAISSNRKNVTLEATRFVTEEMPSTGALIRSFATYTNFKPAVTTGKWICLATTVDLSVDASSKIYAGDLIVPLAEPSAYDSTSGTGGTSPDDSDTGLYLGTEGTLAAVVADFKIAIFGLWNRVLTLAELQAQQRYMDLWVTSGCVCFLNLEPVNLGGTGTQNDASGNANHGAPTGTAFFAHPSLPLGAPRPIYEAFPKPKLRVAVGSVI